MKKELPDTLSGVLEAAYKDVLALEKVKGYRINMGTWHTPRGKACEVCMAGAVMARRMGANPCRGLTPASFCIDDKRGAEKLRAIDSLREGWVVGAANRMGIGLDVWAWPLRKMPPYSRGKVAGPKWREAIRGLIRDLKKAGL